ncbi:hypothetical protein LOK49_LG11G00364 [Camellia lanceoleosa]|uniref:Uncharacterized protein n=1 Tax=Camellia lanceoleosa TaxID=1840588 RepID=A0ACC0FXM4_9ERIC|nr:hypothetical protein LOK49_LG11G00364 [Camellia lanceoleosa]
MLLLLTAQCLLRTLAVSVSYTSGSMQSHHHYSYVRLAPVVVEEAEMAVSVVVDLALVVV